MNKILIVIPVIDEASNIELLIPQILSLTGIDMLFVDGGSTDNTKLVINCFTSSKRVFYTECLGRGNRRLSVNHGFKWAADRCDQWDTLVEMDGDLSHDPNEIYKLINETKNHDLVIGSRYIERTTVEFGSKYRECLSRCANFIIGSITLLPYTDMTGGFRAYNKSAIKLVLEKRCKSPGFSGNIEVLLNISRKNSMKVTEVPIAFRPRLHGKSKMHVQEMVKAISFLIYLRFLYDNDITEPRSRMFHAVSKFVRSLRSHFRPNSAST